MSLRRSKTLTRRSAARALDRQGASGSADVDKILTAATAAGTQFELNREADTMAVFRRSGLAVARPAARPTGLQAARARIAAAPAMVAAGTAFVLVGGGMAVAASTGHLPEALGGHHRSANGATHSSQAPGQAQGQATDKPTPGSRSSQSPNGTPTPSYRGLCHAFQARDAANPGKAQNNPAFTALATKAGGKANIAAYCVSLIGAPDAKPTHAATPTHPPKPTHTAEPTHPAKPTQAATPKASPTERSHPTNPASD